MAPNNALSETTMSDPTPISASEPKLDSPIPPKPSFICRKSVRITLYSLLGAFVIFMVGWGFLPSFLDPTFEKHIQDKEVVAGMTRDQAIAAWGSPYQMNVTYTDRGLRREEWVYEDWIDAGSVQHRYLYFEEGILAGGWYYK